jgi:hypothetical protein
MGRKKKKQSKPWCWYPLISKNNMNSQTVSHSTAELLEYTIAKLYIPLNITPFLILCRKLIG